MGIKSALGKRIRILRTQRRLTLEALAAGSSRSVDALSLIERGRTWPSVETLEAIAMALKVPSEALFESLLTTDDDSEEIVLREAIDALRRMPPLIADRLQDFRYVRLSAG